MKIRLIRKIQYEPLLVITEFDDILGTSTEFQLIERLLDRNFDYITPSAKTIYGQLQNLLGIKIHPAPDEWDRLYNVDFFIEINDKYIGLQIKPAGDVSHIPQIFKEHALQADTHKKFTEKYGGKVFYIISIKQGDKKIIHNPQIIDEIKAEIQRLQSNNN